MGVHAHSLGETMVLCMASFETCAAKIWNIDMYEKTDHMGVYEPKMSPHICFMFRSYLELQLECYQNN